MDSLTATELADDHLREFLGALDLTNRDVVGSQLVNACSRLGAHLSATTMERIVGSSAQLEEFERWQIATTLLPFARDDLRAQLSALFMDGLQKGYMCNNPTAAAVSDAVTCLGEEDLRTVAERSIVSGSLRHIIAGLAHRLPADDLREIILRRVTTRGDWEGNVDDEIDSFLPYLDARGCVELERVLSRLRDTLEVAEFLKPVAPFLNENEIDNVRVFAEWLLHAQPSPLPGKHRVDDFSAERILAIVCQFCSGVTREQICEAILRTFLTDSGFNYRKFHTDAEDSLRPLSQIAPLVSDQQLSAVHGAFIKHYRNNIERSAPWRQGPRISGVLSSFAERMTIDQADDLYDAVSRNRREPTSALRILPDEEAALMAIVTRVSAPNQDAIVRRAEHWPASARSELLKKTGREVTLDFDRNESTPGVSRREEWRRQQLDERSKRLTALRNEIFSATEDSTDLARALLRRFVASLGEGVLEAAAAAANAGPTAGDAASLMRSFAAVAGRAEMLAALGELVPVFQAHGIDVANSMTETILDIERCWP